MNRAVSVEKVLVKDVVHCVKPVVAAAPSMTVDELERLLSAHKIHGVPVLDSGRLVGVVSQSDLALLADGQRLVSDVMSPHVFHIGELAPLREAVELMLDRNVHRLVVTRGEEVSAVLTTTDLLRYLRDILPGSLMG